MNSILKIFQIYKNSNPHLKMYLETAIFREFLVNGVNIWLTRPKGLLDPKVKGDSE